MFVFQLDLIKVSPNNYYSTSIHDLYPTPRQELDVSILSIYVVCTKMDRASLPSRSSSGTLENKHACSPFEVQLSMLVLVLSQGKSFSSKLLDAPSRGIISRCRICWICYSKLLRRCPPRWLLQEQAQLPSSPQSKSPLVTARWLMTLDVRMLL